MYWFCLYYFLVDFNIGTLLVYIPVYLLNVSLLSPLSIGELYLFGGIITIAGSILMSLLAHRVEDERVVLKSGVVIMVLGIIVMIYAKSLMMLYLAFLLIFIMRSALYIIGDDVAINYTNQFPQYKFSKLRSFGSIGWGMNFVINGLIMQYNSKLLFVLWLVTSLLLLVAVIKLPKPKERVKEVSKMDYSIFSKLFANKNYIYFIFANGLIWGVVNNMQQYNQFYLQDLGGSLAIYGIISGSVIIVDFLMMNNSNTFNNFLGDKKYYNFVNIILLSKFILILLTKNANLIYISLLLDPIYFGLCIPFISQFIKKEVGNEVSVVGIALATVFSQGLGSLFAIIFAYVYENLGGHYLFVVFAAIVAFAIIISQRIKFKTK